MTTHPDVAQYPVCAYRGRIRKEPGDCFCRLGDTPGRLVRLPTCLACPHAGSETVQPQRPRCGDVLSEILARRHGATPAAGCACQSKVEQMNAAGPDWCEQNAEEIAGWLIESLQTSRRWQRWIPDAVKRIYFRRLVGLAVRRVRDWKPLTTTAAAGC